MLVSTTLLAQEVWLHPNEGQWDDRIEYKIELDLGEMLIEKDRFYYHLTDAKTHQHENHKEEDSDEETLWQAIQANFIGSNWQGEISETGKSNFYRNYILGNDKTKWKSRIHSYTAVTMKNYYAGIDMILDGRSNNLKYSFKVDPGADANSIQIQYVGHNGLKIEKDGSLRISNRFGEIIESEPVAWLEESGANVEVVFEIHGDTVMFKFPNGYDTNETLIIDPSLVFSTFTGATADNWGMTATPDAQGNLFAGGIIFGLGYPLTPGAYQTGNNSGIGSQLVDVGITKFTADGSNLIYSTYLGGLGSETPNSIVATANNDLYIFGVTSSGNFPMAGNSYDNSYNGGPSAGLINAIDFNGGSDLFVAKLSADGTSLLASTYVGGSNTDGLNISSLRYNYGDQLRGEIILDPFENVLISSTTKSSDFPTLQGTQGALSGPQDAVLFKMSNGLNTMIWSSYFGGSGEETGNSIAVAGNGDVYVAGGTTSSSMPFNNGFDLSFGGVADGYLARFNGNNGSVLSGTFIGDGEYDQTYFVQIDVDDKAYVLGQTESSLGITGGLYGNPNSGQYIQKYNHNLTTQEWKTMVGASTGHVELSPTAFLVSDCYDIYFSGWGGDINLGSPANQSTTFGFPVTADAFQGTTNGSNFYIGVLSENAGSLKYGTFFGGTNNLSDEHVDGGTSRFDKSGRIYHAVCGGCQGNSNGFTTTAGAWSQINAASGGGSCNLAAFKFELNTIEALISTPNTVVCIPNPANFTNNSANGNTFFWDFGDNNTSTAVNPSHVYGAAGTYTVTLIVSDSNACFTPDTVDFIINIGDFGGGIVPLLGPICPGEPEQLEAYGGASYLWSPAQYLDDPTIFNPTITITQQQVFMVIISDSCGIDTAYITVDVFDPAGSVSDDIAVCIGDSTVLQATGGGTYSWSPALYLDDPNVSNPVCTPQNNIQYNVEIITPNGCVVEESVNVSVDFTSPIPIMPDELNVCQNSTFEISVSGATSYSWSPNVNISATDTNFVTITSGQSMYYYCLFSNACDQVLDSVFINVVQATISAGNDTTICPGETATIWAEGGISYLWSPAGGLSNPYTSLTNATPNVSTTYTVIGTDINGCTNSDTVRVELFPQPYVITNPNVYAFYGDQVQLYANSSSAGPLSWYPTEFLSCVNCSNPIANPNQNYTYWVEFVDQNGCVAVDTVKINYDPTIYIPNTFTPGGEDDLNAVFQAVGGNIKTFEMLIFNRWGELIFTFESLNDSWDGTFGGKECQDGTYVWKVTLTDLEDEESTMTGHVNLLR